ncbi:metal ABC transporter ATP-binding protein [Mangrovibacterium marinum]|uniref:Zinc transport system ATP-binding protein n=1 Tax=Mangrovibacterium marinum TaxID=1639118 RepID=A0A2T5C109_9BACT|nr:metal ABC transporter ATP-binding protein [Mangrovibacterium marinum]PTN08302.1 zinc transport system ATP-binding protein [Mangrovibacterium marinum]
MQKLLEIKELTVSYDHEVVLNDVNLTVHKGDFLGVIGPNGGGKTSLIKAILGLVKPSKGQILFHIPQTRIGYLPQINQIDKRFPITVLDVVRSGKTDRRSFSLFAKQTEEIAHAESLLNEMGVWQLRHKAIGELSGGQMQRVFLCRSLMNRPELLILDEPDTFVDNQFESELYEKLKELNQRMAIVLVSHDVGTISYYVKTIACVARELHYHPSNIISTTQLASYNCPLQIITHGDVPHTVLGLHDKHQHDHKHDHEHDH